MGRPGWAAPDGRYFTHLLRGEHQLELDAEIARWTRGQTVDALLDVLDRAGCRPAGSTPRPTSSATRTTGPGDGRGGA
ncbi:hypothetical protein ACR6C2_01740 [Streptomyces sp. INA 01156]